MPDKSELAHIFEEIAVLLEIKGDNPFKIRAYQGAARILEQLSVELERFVADGGLENTKGIGKAIAEKIREYLAEGKISYYEDLRAAIPPIIFELIKIPGLGPKKALALHELLGINSIGELEYACRENRLVELPGFGAKTQDRILEGIQYIKIYQGRFLLSDAWPLADKFAAYLRSFPAVVQADVAGSIRRRKEIVKDIDIVVAGEQMSDIGAIIAKMPGVRQVTGKGLTKVSVALEVGLNMDIRIVRPEEYTCALHHLTGSKEHHVQLRGLAKDQGLKINEYGIERDNGEKVAVSDEAAFYRVFGLDYIEPELREGADEIELAAQGRLPELVTMAQICGVFHLHTTYSDGGASLAQMAGAVKARGWEYAGINDHSRSAVYARGLKLEDIQRQRAEIDAYNAAAGNMFLLAGIESDILPDGSLDYPDEVLAQFDFVIASVHSSFRQSKDEMTARIIKAMNNRYVSMLGHPTGRILLAREGYDVDIPAVVKAAAGTGTIIEINASPYRLDLDWRWCRQAKEQGVLFAVNPDAHSIEDLDFVSFGVASARKGWLTAADVINTRDVKGALALLGRKRNS